MLESAMYNEEVQNKLTIEKNGGENLKRKKQKKKIHKTKLNDHLNEIDIEYSLQTQEENQQQNIIEKNNGDKIYANIAEEEEESNSE